MNNKTPDLPSLKRHDGTSYEVKVPWGTYLALTTDLVVVFFCGSVLSSDKRGWWIAIALIVLVNVLRSFQYQVKHAGRIGFQDGRLEQITEDNQELRKINTYLQGEESDGAK
jgi:hypothetical protein